MSEKKIMKVKDLFEIDIDFIKAIYEEFYKEDVYHTENNTLNLFEKLLIHNDNKEYEVSLNVNSYDYQQRFYFFFTSNDGDIYLLELGSCSCGWDFSVESNWKRFVENVLEEELIILVDKLIYDLKLKKVNNGN